MESMKQVGRFVQSLLNDWARQAADESGVIQRQRRFDAATLAQTFVLGHLDDPFASDDHLAGVAAQCGVNVSPQAIDQRVNSRLVGFLEALFRKAVRHVVAGNEVLSGLLAAFPAVVLLDSTTITLPAELAERFPGCGGNYGGGRAALKLQVLFDLKTGALRGLEIEAGRQCDQKASVQWATLPKGSLRIADLGYFDTEVFEELSAEETLWLSRLQCGTSVFLSEGKEAEKVELLEWLGEQPTGKAVDRDVWIHSTRKVPCRLIAWRVPEETANRRRQKLIQETVSRTGRQPSRERLAWCDWMILVTNVPEERISVREAAVLYRSRWQIELLFKRWKSQGGVAKLTGRTVTHQMVRLWSRLIAAVLTHWVLIASVWGNARLSLAKATQALQGLSQVIVLHQHEIEAMTQALMSLTKRLPYAARRNKRSLPNIFQQLENPSLLEWDIH